MRSQRAKLEVLEAHCFAGFSLNPADSMHAQ